MDHFFNSINMKIYQSVLALIALCASVCSCGNHNDVEGAWYGLHDRSLLTMTFNADSTVSVKSEAFSSLSFTAKVDLNREANPMTIDLKGASNGMDGAGLARINEDKSLDLCINFGAPGMVARPEKLDSVSPNMTTLCFHLVRSKEEAEAPLAVTYEIPAEAQKAFERNKRLGAGINLNAVADGNQHTPDAPLDAPLKPGEIKSIADQGFKSIRFDVCWVKHCAKERPYTIDPAFFAKIDGIVDECLKNDLAVSIDQHYYPYINMEGEHTPEEYEENFVRLEMLWQQIAEHYKDYSCETLFFDLLNEPNLTLGADRWNELVGKLTKTIHKITPDRTILVLTPNLGQSWTLGYLELPQDDWNIIVQFHYYLPHLFSHQGLAYAQAGDSHNVKWMGTDDEKAMIESDLDYCARWSKQHGRPLNMGEYGCVNTADQASRVRYIGFMREASEARGFSSHLWGYREPFMIRDEKTGEWIKPIVDAMKLK